MRDYVGNTTLINLRRNLWTFLKCLSNTRWGSDRPALLGIYCVTTRSQLDYSCQAYASAPDHVLTDSPTLTMLSTISQIPPVTKISFKPYYIFRDSRSDSFTELPHSKPFGTLSMEILNKLNVHIPPTLPSTMPAERYEPPCLASTS